MSWFSNLHSSSQLWWSYLVFSLFGFAVFSYNDNSDVLICFFLQVFAPFMWFMVRSRLNLSLYRGMSKRTEGNIQSTSWCAFTKKSVHQRKWIRCLSKAVSVRMLLLCLEDLKKLFIIVARDKIGTSCKCLLSACVLLRTGLDMNWICDSFVCDYICYTKCGIIWL